jgi:DNA-directed RNA polymerase subunit RPC12/RpoP
MSFGKDSSFVFIMQDGVLTEVGRLDNNATRAPLDPLEEEVFRIFGEYKELMAASPQRCWRKCWSCGKEQIHISPVYPYVLCRFCGSQDTRLLKDKTQALKGNQR